MTLWTLEAFLAATGGRLIGKAGDIGGISIDSRTVDAGDAYFSIKGDRFDGHQFAGAAIANGAALSVVSEAKLAELGDIAPLVVVDDVLSALERLGMAARARMHGKVIAVTGSVGKTSTKEALRQALLPSGKTHAAVASFNNHWGVPLTLARMPADCDFGVFEIGMNHAGEITPLTRMVRPHVAIITTVEPVHLEFFPSVEAIADAKAEIVQGLEPGGVAILNKDNPHFARLADATRAEGMQVMSFGACVGADAWLEKAALRGDGSSVKAQICGAPVTYKMGAPGRHQVQNSLAVLLAVHLVGGHLAHAMLALGELQAPKGRGAQAVYTTPHGDVTVVDESYNANPASMRAAFALLAQCAVSGRGRRIAVLGDMLELGADSAALHAGLCTSLVDEGIDRVYCSGPEMQALWQMLPAAMRGAYAGTSEELEPLLLNDVVAGDVLMIKGSLGSRMGRIVQAFARHFAETNDSRT